jgi:replicative DNA helicase
MGTLQVGDEVFGSDGKPYRVLNKSAVHQRPCYRVTFDDATSIVCDNVHLWEVHSGRRGEKVEVLSTDQLAKQLFDESSGQRDKRITNAAPLQLPDVDLPIHPYVLGCWLGDGKRSSGEVCKPDVELFEHIERCGYDVAPESKYHIRTVYGLRRQLLDAGIFGHRFIPGQYFRASGGQRLALLQGLMDTDGCWNRTRHQAVFTTVDKSLADGVRELVVSLGWKARVWELQKTGFDRTVTAYDVTFTPVGDNPFRLSRKADLVREAPTRAKRRLIVSVEPTFSVPTQCIEVDSPNSLYLCGEAMVPTHNTGKRGTYLRHNVQGTVYAYASTQPEFWSGWSAHHTEGFGRDYGAELYEQFETAARRFWWIDLNAFKWVDGGFRGDLDYERLRLTVQAVGDSIQNEIFPLTLDGDVCEHCPVRDACGGIGVDDTAGAIA